MKLIHMQHFPGVSRNLLRQFLLQPSLLSVLYDLSPEDFQSYFFLKPDVSRRLHHYLHHSHISSVIDDYFTHKIHIITLLDPVFPEQLKHIPDPPPILYCKGHTALLNPTGNLLSVVGSRKTSIHMNRTMNVLLEPLIKKNFTIVSGLASGVDGYAHRLALKSSTIAVLGSGLYHPYPSSNRKLFDEISQNHLVLSEYPPQFQPKKWYFPERNRIISGLSPATLVIEAKARSGSLITADQALEQGRDVFAVPGSIFDEYYSGTNYLIQQGAKAILNAQDLLNEYE